MKLKILIGVVVIALAVVAVIKFTGGDDDSSKSGDTSAKSSDARDKDDSKADSDSDADAGDEPALRTAAVKRAKGRDAAVTVGALVRKPDEIWLRVSSAPKQKVTVNWTLACGVGATAQGDYDVTPPDTRQLELPKKNPKTCVASASTQIGKGRVKLAVMRDR